MYSVFHTPQTGHLSVGKQIGTFKLKTIFYSKGILEICA